METAHLKKRSKIHNPFKAPAVGIWVRSHIFIDHKLDAIWEYIKTGRRNRTFNKLIHYAHNTGGGS